MGRIINTHDICAEKKNNNIIWCIPRSCTSHSRQKGAQPDICHKGRAQKGHSPRALPSPSSLSESQSRNMKGVQSDPLSPKPAAAQPFQHLLVAPQPMYSQPGGAWPPWLCKQSIPNRLKPTTLLPFCPVTTKACLIRMPAF